MAVDKPRSGLSPGTESAGNLILDFWPPQLRSICHLSHQSIFCYSSLSRLTGYRVQGKYTVGRPQDLWKPFSAPSPPMAPLCRALGSAAYHLLPVPYSCLLSSLPPTHPPQCHQFSVNDARGSPLLQLQAGVEMGQQVWQSKPTGATDSHSWQVCSNLPSPGRI